MKFTVFRKLPAQSTPEPYIPDYDFLEAPYGAERIIDQNLLTDYYPSLLSPTIASSSENTGSTMAIEQQHQITENTYPSVPFTAQENIDWSNSIHPASRITECDDSISDVDSHVSHRYGENRGYIYTDTTGSDFVGENLHYSNVTTPQGIIAPTTPGRYQSHITPATALPVGCIPMLPPDHPHSHVARLRQQSTGLIARPVVYRWKHDALDEDLEPTPAPVHGQVRKLLGASGDPSSAQLVGDRPQLRAPVVAPRPANESYEEMRERQRIAAKEFVRQRREMGVRGVELDGDAKIQRWMDEVELAQSKPKWNLGKKLKKAWKRVFTRKQWVYTE